MKQVSNTIKNALKKSTTQRKGRILTNGIYYDVYNVEYYADCYDRGNVIGNAIASLLDFDIPYTEKFNTFRYFDGVWTGSSYEYVDLGEFEVFDEKENDKFTKHITAYDKLLKFNAPFIDKKDYPKTLYKELTNICEQANVGLLNSTIPNGNFIIENNQFVSGENLKSVLKEICRITGTYATIKNDKINLQLKNITNEKMVKSQHEPIDWKRKTYGINQVIIGSSTIKGEYSIREDKNDIAKNGVHKLVINDNLFAYTQEKREALIDGLFNQVKGFGYIPYELKGEWLNYLELGDSINLDGIDTIVLRINGRSPKALESTMSAPAIIDSSLDYVDNTNDVKNQLKKTEVSVDKQNQIIQSVVVNEEAQNQNISEIKQTVDELNSKIKDIADITVAGETEFSTVDLNGVNESEPIYIKVRPTKINISYLYPNSKLYPKNNLYMPNRVIRFYNKTKKKETFYQLPTDLLYYNKNTYDELILDYDSKSCMVNKKVKYNADGTTSPLPKMKTIKFDYPTIPLEAGDYTISVYGYNDAYIFIRMMAENIYTTQFATKVELHSEISQTATEINSEVSKKVGKDEVISRINQTAEAVTIDAQKININGVINAVNNNTTTTIDGGKITSGSITTQQLEANSITADKIQTDAITTDKIKANAINGSKIQAGSIDSTKVTADVITTNNFNAQKINADNITAGTLTGRTINGGSVTGAKISGGSIDINRSGYYFNMGKVTSHPNCSGLNVGFGGINVNNLGFNSDGNTWTFAGDLKAGNFKTFGKVTTNDVVANSMINLLAGGSSGSASNGGILLRTGNGHITLDAGNGAGYVYASGVGIATSKVKTDRGSASSKNTKTNFVKFDKNNYQEVLELLNNIDIYSYDYKYDLYDNKHQYGFIIDEIEKQNNYDKYFDFRKEKAKVKGNHIDFQVEENDKDYIEVKKYNEDTLDKYMLACLKAQQQEIEQLKQEIKELKNMI